MPKLPWKLRTCPTEHTVGAKEKHELLFCVFVHDGSSSPSILFLSRGARLCYRSPTNGLVLGASCGFALSELQASTENVQFPGCGTDSPKGTYWVGGYAAKELRFSMLNVPTKRYVVSLTTTGQFYGLCSF